MKMIGCAQFTAGSDIFAWCVSPSTLMSTAVMNSGDSTFSLVRCSEPLDRTKTTGEDADTKCLIVEPQDSKSSLIALVPAASPAVVVRLFDVRQSRRLRDLTFPSPVRAVRLNMKRLVVMLEDQVQIFDAETLRNLHKFDAPRQSSTSDCCALSANCILAIAAARSGSVLLFDALNLRVLQVIAAHQTPVTCLALSEDGQYLATASEQGTLVRLFSVISGEKVCVFRRGAYSCKVRCLAFSPLSPPPVNSGGDGPVRRAGARQNNLQILLAVGSDNGTVHVFPVPVQASSASAGYPYAPTQQTNPLSETSSTIVSMISNWLPMSVSDLVEPTRCMWLARTLSSPMACCFYEPHQQQNSLPMSTTPATTINPAILLRVVTQDGYFREFTLDGKSPFELPMKRQVRLFVSEDSNGSTHENVNGQSSHDDDNGNDAHGIDEDSQEGVGHDQDEATQSHSPSMLDD